MDVKTAFLHSTLKADVYVCQPKGFIDVDHPIHVYKLKKTLYGLKQAPGAWYDELSKFLLQNHFFKVTVDPTLFIRRFDDDILVVQVYVDDIIFGSTNPRTPMKIKDILDLDQNGTLVDATKYHSMIGALMYLPSSRTDIVHATCLCARYQAKPTEKHLKEVKRIFRYFRGTFNTGLWYTKDYGFELTGFSDADYAGCKDTFKSTSGGTQFLGEKLVGWSLKNKTVWCCQSWKQNMSISISCNPVQHSRTKCIALRYHFIKEHVEKGMIELYFVKTDYQLADLFTKALSVDSQNRRDLPKNTSLDRVEVLDKMADENVPTPALTRSDDQILSFAAWMPIEKSNYAKTNAYNFELDETRFILDANLLREALEITPVDQAHQFVSPPQTIQTFLTDKANLGSPTKKGKKDKPYVIPYCRFTKLIICHLGRIHNIHQRSASPFHLAEEDFRLGNLKFISKGEADEVFGMQIPHELISNNIINAPYYNAYLEMVAKHDQKVAAKKEGKKKSASAKQPKSKPAIEKSSKPTPVPKPKATKERPSKASTAKPPKPKHAKEKSTKTTPPQQADKDKIAKVRKVKSPFQLVDEPDEEPTHSKPEIKLIHQGECDKDDMELAIQMRLESFQAQSQSHVGGVAIREHVAEATQPLPVLEGKGKAIVTKEQAAHSLLALHTPKRRSTTDQFIFQRQTSAIKASSTGPSAQAQDDTSANIIYDSPFPVDVEIGVASKKTNSVGDTEILQINEEQGKDVDEQVNLKEKTDELDQGRAGSDLVELLIIDLSPPKPASSTTQEPIFTATTTTTTTTLPPPPQQQSTTESELAVRVTSLEKKLYDLEQKNKTLDDTSQNLGSRVFTLELRDLPHKIDEAVCESRMFETGTYKSLPEHVALYKALEASIERVNRDELLIKMDKLWKYGEWGLEIVVLQWWFVVRVVVAWRDKGVFGSSDPKILTTLSSSPK
nr:hypothetical protein [Tanacetum cinerariifolium]